MKKVLKQKFKSKVMDFFLKCSGTKFLKKKTSMKNRTKTFDQKVTPQDLGGNI
jgi:hypothetical protein